MKSRQSSLRLLLAVPFIVLLVGAYFLIRGRSPQAGRSARLMTWFSSPQSHSDWAITIGTRCNGAPFIFPTSGYIGFLWGDSFRIGHRHQGIDIFGGEESGVTPVWAAYSGYLTRLPEWKSSLIVRVPNDPLQPGRQIWVYYTHLADEEGESFIAPAFPPGTSDAYVEAGTLLGYQGNYSGNPINPTGIHLHFSIVKDKGGEFLNELEFENTLDPSPYLGLRLNASENQGEVPVCDG